MNTFWMVYNPKRQAPRVRHDTFVSADAEARRLAALQPGDEFFVLQGITVYAAPAPVVPPVTVRGLL